jgi:hypothetical protein
VQALCCAVAAAAGLLLMQLGGRVWTGLRQQA